MFVSTKQQGKNKSLKLCMIQREKLKCEQPGIIIIIFTILINRFYVYLYLFCENNFHVSDGRFPFGAKNKIRSVLFLHQGKSLFNKYSHVKVCFILWSLVLYLSMKNKQNFRHSKHFFLTFYSLSSLGNQSQSALFYQG